MKYKLYYIGVALLVYLALILLMVVVVSHLVPLFEKPTKEMSDRVSVYEDEENGVSCYILDEKAISCIPNQFLTTKNE